MALNPGDLYFHNRFNDATRVLEGGLWHTAVQEGGQGFGSDVRYIGDITVVQTGLLALLAAGDFAGAELVAVNRVLADITTVLGAVPGAVQNNAAAEATLRTAHLDIINTIEHNAVLQAASLALTDANPGFNFPPPAMDHPANHKTPHATFAELGAIFDDAQSRSLGGINADNFHAIQGDLKIVHDGLQDLINHDKGHHLFDVQATVHAQTIVDQINLQVTNFDKAYGANPVAARATNDNFLDITDIVAGDAVLTNLAHANGVNGWTGAPDTDVVTPKYLDNAAQTNFWADFIASGNTLGAQAQALVQTGSNQQIKAFVNVLGGWLQNVTKFDDAQNGIFQARFDNELLGANSTVGADVAAMTKGLQTHDAALVAVAAQGFHDNAMDVGGNNIPVGGGTFNPEGKTIAEALMNSVAPPPPVKLLTPTAPVKNGYENDHDNDHNDLMSQMHDFRNVQNHQFDMHQQVDHHLVEHHRWDV